MLESENTFSSIKGDGTFAGSATPAAFHSLQEKIGYFMVLWFLFWCGLEVDGLDKD